MNIPWSKMAQNTPSSVVRDMLQAAQAPGMISLAGGLPAQSSFPLEAIRDAYEKVFMGGSAALQYASDNIRVSAVAPGYVESGMVNKEALGDYYDTLVDRHPIGRLGQPEEIAHGVIFLAENEFATGLVLPIEGGYTAQ